MADSESFTFIESETKPTALFGRFQELTSAYTADHDIQYQAALRKAFPELILTAVPLGNCNFLAFARAGHATAELDTVTDSFAAWRGWVPALRSGQHGTLASNLFFAKYHYRWNDEDFILYTVGTVQYVLKEPRDHEQGSITSETTDALIAAVGGWQTADQKIIWVFDYGYGWTRSKALYNQVHDASWEKVILDEDMKKTLVDISGKFFESKEIYTDLGVPWKRGIIFYGPAGNGKTISIKALMHTLLERKQPIPALYVKSAPNTYAIKQVFNFARTLSPCMLIFEDIDTVVTANTRSYFFNEVDGLENNDGILMVASTNHLDRLDHGITKRPSRFDRKYLFPLPSEHERTLYCEYWRHKIQSKGSVEFPSKLCHAIAEITNDFSFAYLQEAFVASLLEIARRDMHSDQDVGSSLADDDDDDLDQYDLWVIIKEQVRILREDMDSANVTQQVHNAPTQAAIPSPSHPPGLENPPNMVDNLQKLTASDLGTVDLPFFKHSYINQAAFEFS